MRKETLRDKFHEYLKEPELKEQDLVAALEKLRTDWHQQRKQELDAKWTQNLAFYSGQHFVRSKGDDPGKVRVKENHTNNIIQRIASIVVQNIPIVRPFPAGDAYDDIQAAESCEAYLKYWRTVKKLELKYTKLVRYSLIMGNGFIHRQWDPYVGGNMYLSEEESNGNPGVKRWSGDIRVDIDDPFKINVRPGIDELDDMWDYFRSVPSNKQEIEAMYGPVEADPVKAMNGYTGQVRADDSQCMVHHYYHKPMHWWHEGVYICWAGKKILKASPFPYLCGNLQLDHLPFDKAPMKFWAMSSMDQIMDLQEQLDKAASMIIEARNAIARPMWMVHANAKMPSVSNQPNKVNKWEGSIEPKAVVPSFNFAELAAHKADVRGALQGVSGLGSASRGEIPAATKTALALQLVLEQDRSQFAPYIKQLFQIVKTNEAGILDLAAQYIDETDPRSLKIEENGMVGTKTFHGGLVPSPLDVWLEDTNPLGWTSGARIENVQTLAQMGVLKDPNQVLEMLKLHNPDQAYQAQHISRQTAKKENEILNKGIPVEVESEDIDPVHLDEHTKDMQSFEYKQKPNVVKRVYEEHVAKHKERMQPPPGAAPGGPDPQQVQSNESALKGLETMAGSSAPPSTGPDRMNELLTSARSG